ncbi:MAG: Uncharacterised protein [Acidimicrobiales bacterium AG-410-I20]|nr:MAG: Uncharacterised protein [Acidimicrobiales bacterium AG-410-I20]
MKLKHYRFLLLLFLFLLIFGSSSCSKPERPRLVTDENLINEVVATSSSVSLTTTSEIQPQSESPVEVVELDTEIPLTIPVVAGYAIVKEKIPILDIYTSPDSDSIYSEGLTNPGPFEGLRTLQTTGHVEGKFLEVILPRLPNGSKAWVLSKDVEIFYSDKKIVVDLSERTAKVITSKECSVFDLSEMSLTACKDSNNKILAEAPVAIGKDSTPTPLLDAVIDYLWERSTSSVDFSQVYGDRIFGLNQHSEVLDNFNGKRPAIAIHSTSSPELIGGKVSNGCIRMKPEDIEIFLEHVTLGMKVQIVD